MIQRVREEKHQHLAHHGLIKLIVKDALNKLKIHFLWSSFIYMDKETLIGTWNITPGDTPASSLGDRDTRVDEEETEEEEMETEEGKKKDSEEVMESDEEEEDKEVEK